jgi:hypothetical protein
MLKRLALKYWPMVALIIFIGAILSMSRYAEHRKAEQSNNTQVSSPQTAVAPNDDSKSKENPDKTKYRPDFIDTFTWPEGATVWALFLTLIVIAWQSTETRDAAKAALLNAQALINSERPWIMATIEESIGPRGGFQLYVTNKGRSPAMITEAQLGCVVAPDVSALPKRAPYGDGSMAKDRIILHGEKQVMTWFSAGTLKNIVGEDFPFASGEEDVFVFGRIVYRDLLGPPSSPDHETRWIGLYQFPTEADGDSIFHFQGIGVPDEYDRYS